MKNEETDGIRRHHAKVEYLALKEEIERRLRAGYSVRAIYEDLKGSGHLSMCYSSFCCYIRRSISLASGLEAAHERRR